MQAVMPNTRLARTLNWVELAGSKLPHPFTLFFYLVLLTIGLSALFAWLDVSSLHPISGQQIQVRSLVSGAGLEWFVTHFTDNITRFAPFGLVIVMAIGIGFAEQVGCIFAALRLMVTRVPKATLGYAMAFTGIMGNIASDAAFIIIPPLAALVFLAAGRHPLAGFISAFTGAAGGFSANLLIGGNDVLLAGITNEALLSVSDQLQVSPVSNWYFLIVSVFLLTLAGGLVTDYLIEPRLGRYQQAQQQDALEPLSERERKGLRYVLYASLAFWGLITALVVPEASPLRNPDTGGLVPSPFMSGLVTIIFFYFIVIGLVYGFTVGTLASEADIPVILNKATQVVIPFIVLTLVIAQFIYMFNWTNLGAILAIKGAELLKLSGLSAFPLLVALILLVAVLNLFLGSASAKWSLLAPVLIPMFAFLDISPSVVQMAYRIGDSATNPISPLFPYLPIMLSFIAKYKEDAHVGTLFAMALPYSIAFLLLWIAQLGLWMLLDLPLGPDAASFSISLFQK
ncbi:AbgT family transporter [Zobellella aerophila]|uniref:p-aminobenzoyl-glutamate transporter n=1 Tax=Zobellella aerophila TaxID=870480 RepID=A0ABP6VFY1_9GAMM